jgi:mRNA interferase YafQ
MLRLEYSSQFERDVKLLKRKHYNLEEMKDLIRLIGGGAELPRKYRKHQLKGAFGGMTECHIKGDWLLVYKRVADMVVFVRTGSHDELFK